MNEAREQIRGKQRRFRFEDARDSLLRRDAEEAGKLRSLPLPTRAASTPQLDSIANAPAPALHLGAAIEDAVRRTAPKPRKAEQTPAQKVAWADRILEAARLGAAVDADELKRAQLFAQSSAYRAEKVLSGFFGTAPAQPTTADRRQRA
jgi:hypothetical protein